MADRTCSIDGCDAPHQARGMCKPHYRRDYYQRNKARENANFKAYREANLDHEKARFAEWYESSGRKRGETQRTEQAAAEGRTIYRRARTEGAKATKRAATEKQCPRCKETKPMDQFHTDPRRVDGRYSWCKVCHYEHQKATQDPVAIRDQRRQRYQNDPEYRARRNGQGRRSHKKRYANDPEYAELVRQRVREWAEANPEKASLNARKGANRRRSRIKNQTVGEVDYKAILERDGMVCHLCGGDITTFDDLHFDHVIPLARGGEHSAENVKPSHAKCNLRKGTKLLEELN